MQGYNNCDHIYTFGDKQNQGQLWLGDFNSAKNKRLHRERGIQTVITAGLGMNIAISEPCKHRLYPLYDSPSENIQRFFTTSYEHIEEALQRGNVLVHCFAGVSRSSTIVTSFLMKKLNWSYKQAIDHVRKKRWVVNPNPGFVKQLKKLQIKLKEGGGGIINNPQSPQKTQGSLYKTFKLQIKKEISLKMPQSSTTMTKSALVRGKSTMQPKSNTRTYGSSISKR